MYFKSTVHTFCLPKEAPISVTCTALQVETSDGKQVSLLLVANLAYSCSWVAVHRVVFPICLAIRLNKCNNDTKKLKLIYNNCLFLLFFVFIWIFMIELLSFAVDYMHVIMAFLIFI